MGKRKTWSIKEELLTKSREAMLSAVQIFNNPNIHFKSETYIVLSTISWTYLLHAYFRDKGIEYRYHTAKNGRKRYDRTKRKAYKFYELERCLNCDESPVESIVAANLRFLIGLRHEIEHQMTNKIDEYLSARFQACCLNYNDAIKSLFDTKYGIDKHLSFSLQFSSIKDEHAAQLRQFTDLPQNISAYINAFDDDLTEQEFNDSRFAYRVLYVPKIVNKKGQADKVIEFLKADSPAAQHINKEYVVIKDRELKKHLPTQICKSMQAKGFTKFKMYQHTQLWQSLNAKGEGKGFGVQVENMWYWYEKWVEVVEMHCNENKERYI
ncbi:hypothetical protein HDC90_002847 [Pedobacter sp. AK013]|uniref:DUF3644 domain-containing protein n=1 Tax=Pedobacter sp. AK013 TaxID=2723071 RepID=UPI0016096410|nr:DUF3644 domain-containing protein [Pedobacter sp. AK013]MBB6238215.1 hypothetical protein [Pedobacter sp. AK013]